MNRFSTLTARLADSMLTQPGLSTWGVSTEARTVAPKAPAPSQAGPLSGWSWGL